MKSSKVLGAIAAFALLTYGIAQAMFDQPLLVQYIIAGGVAYMVLALPFQVFLVVCETARRFRNGTLAQSVFRGEVGVDPDPPPVATRDASLGFINITARVFGALLFTAGIGALAIATGAAAFFGIVIAGLGVAFLAVPAHTFDGKPGSWLTGAPRNGD